MMDESNFKNYKDAFSNPLDRNNPITVQALGVCSALMVTSSLAPAIVMGLSVVLIIAFSSLFVCLLRKVLPSKLRYAVEIGIVTLFVTIINELLKSFAYDISISLSIYVGLIITNCIVLGKVDSVVVSKSFVISFFDAIGTGLGYAKILIIVAFFRELLGSGTLLGFNILNYDSVRNIGYLNNNLFLMPPMALIILACIVWYQRSHQKQLIDK